MDLGRFLQELGSRFLVTLGLVSVLTVAFGELTVEKLRPQEFRIETRLEGAFPEELKKLLFSSTEIEISYKVIFYTPNNTKRTRLLTRSVIYRSLTKSFEIETETDRIETADYTVCEEAMTTINLLFNPEEINFFVIKAYLDIPDMKDKQLIQTLWGGITPSVTWNKEE